MDKHLRRGSGRYGKWIGLLLIGSLTAVLAQADTNGQTAPACSPGDRDQRMLERVNQARSQARQCGDESFGTAPPLVWNCKLASAARTHTDAMVQQQFFGHTGPDGKQVSDRVSAAGYEWRAVGENVAAGQSSVEEVMEGWLASPGHCRNIMKAEFQAMGAARSADDGSTYAPYWTQVFARPR